MLMKINCRLISIYLMRYAPRYNIHNKLNIKRCYTVLYLNSIHLFPIVVRSVHSNRLTIVIVIEVTCTSTNITCILYIFVWRVKSPSFFPQRPVTLGDKIAYLLLSPFCSPRFDYVLVGGHKCRLFFLSGLDITSRQVRAVHGRQG